MQVDAYDAIFRDFSATKLDVVKPGFFNEHRSELIVGTMVDCRLGDPQDGIKRVWLQVIDSPRQAGEGDVLVAVGSVENFTPVRHDGGLANEGEAA